MQQLTVLEEVLSRHGTSGAELLAKASSANLSRQERGVICAHLAGELMANEIEESGEPTARGLVIEAIIDAVNRPNLTD